MIDINAVNKKEPIILVGEYGVYVNGAAGSLETADNDNYHVINLKHGLVEASINQLPGAMDLAIQLNKGLSALTEQIEKEVRAKTFLVDSRVQ